MGIDDVGERPPLFTISPIEVLLLPRQARLNASLSPWYPRITPGRWHHALWVREMALASLRKGEPQWEEREGDRVLSDAHFEFQGGRNSPKATPGVERRMLRRGPEAP